MAAQTQKRFLRAVRFSGKELPATAATYFQGSTVGWDTSVGRIVKVAASTTIIPIGFVTEDKVVATNGDPLHVNLFREVVAYWFVNATAGDAVAAANKGSLCYGLDDQTAASNDATNTRSVLGRVWDVDTVKGVLVEPRDTTGDRLGGLDA